MQSSNDAPLDVGVLLRARYELRRRIGEGGMGVVFEGFDRLLEKRVAVKVLHPEQARNPSIAARFSLEAKIASAFHHPNVATTFDVGEHGGCQFLVMEYLDGISLADALGRAEPIGDAAAVALIEPIARALASAHKAGVIHRDVKPDNIFLCVGERVGEAVPKLVDFGIARRDQISDFRITATTAIIGTPAYMPPEQARGAEHITPAVDQYSLGVVLFEMLSGTRPHDAPTAAELLALKLTEPPAALGSLAPHVGERLATVVMRALETDPVKRFSDMRALRDALVAAVEQLDYPRFPSTRAGSTPLGPHGDASTEAADSDRSPAPVGGQAIAARGPVPTMSRRTLVLPFVGTFGALALVAGTAASVRGAQARTNSASLATYADIASTQPTATLTVRVDPPGASIVMNGQQAGTGRVSVRAQIGTTVALALSAEGFVARRETVVVREDQTIQYQLDPVASESTSRADVAPRGSLQRHQHMNSMRSTPVRSRPALQLDRTGLVLDTEINRR